MYAAASPSYGLSGVEYADAASLGGFYDVPGTETGLEGLFSKLLKPVMSFVSHNKNTIGTLAPIAAAVAAPFTGGATLALLPAIAGAVASVGSMLPTSGPAPSGITIDPELGAPAGVTLIYAPPGADLALPGAQKAALPDGRVLYALPPGAPAPPSFPNFTSTSRTTAAGSTVVTLVPLPIGAPAGSGAAVPASINTGSIMLLAGIAVALLLARRS